MTTKPPPKPRIYPIEAFGPELLAALIRGSKERLEIPFPQYRLAFPFTRRLSQLRSQMRLQSHPLANVVARCKITIIWPPDTATIVSEKRVHRPRDSASPCTVVLLPRDSEFSDVLKRAGITSDELRREVLDDLPHTADGEPVEDFLDQFTKPPAR